MQSGKQYQAGTQKERELTGMAYADIEFYKIKYCGNVVPDEFLEKYLEKASDRIDEITFDRLVDGFPDNKRAQTKVKKAVCEVADCLYQIDEVKKVSMATMGTVTREDGTMIGKMVSSISSGAESISYVTGTPNNSDSIYFRASIDKKMEDLLIGQIASNYLSYTTDKNGIYLLYSGI